MVGVDEGRYLTAGVVEYFYLQHSLGSDGELAGGGIRVDGNAVEVGHVGNAHLVDGQLQYDDAIATSLGLSFIDVLATFGVGLTVPLIAVGGGVEDGGVAAIVDGEMQRDGAVAIDGIGGDKGGSVSTLGVDRSVPLKAVAGRENLVGRGAVVDSEVQGDDAVASGDVG